MGRLGIRAPLLVLLGAIALVVSFLLTPTPDTFAVLSNEHRVRVAAEMHGADYAILILRIGGAVAVLAGAYVAYRRWRPDRMLDGEDRPGDRYDRFKNMPPEGGDPATRAAVTRRF
jgi:hypothetical protein